MELQADGGPSHMGSGQHGSRLMRSEQRRSRLMRPFTMEPAEGTHVERPRIKETEALLQEALGKQEAERSKIDFAVPRTGETSTGKFIGGKYIELGVRTNSRVGALGTDDKPAASEFNGGTVSSGIGIVSNQAGFDDGPSTRTNEYVESHEAFWIGYKEDAAGTIKDSGTNCGSAHTVKTQVDGTLKAELLFEATRGNLLVVQEATIGVEDRFIRFDVRMHNMHTEDTMYDVRYMRSVNPGNTVDHGGSSSTTQTHEVCGSCPSHGTAVSALSYRWDAYYNASSHRQAKMLYYTEDPRAKVSHGSSGSSPPGGVWDTQVYETARASGATQHGDTWMSITVNINELHPGQSSDFAFFVYVGDETMADAFNVLQHAAAKAYGKCDLFTCASGSIVKLDAPVTCHADPCTQSECCAPRATCDTLLKDHILHAVNDTRTGCHRFGSYVPKDDPTTHFCEDIVCDDTDPLLGEENTDRDFCCDLECDAYTLDDCPTTRATNVCQTQHGECDMACGHFKTEEECPTHGEAADGEMDYCIWESGICKALAVCDATTFCPHPMVLKMHFPDTCAGTACVPTDCCGPAVSCNISDCPPPELMLKAVPATTCERTECEEHECCDPFHAREGSNGTDSNVTLAEFEAWHNDRHDHRYQALLQTPAGLRDPTAHPLNLIYENAMLQDKETLIEEASETVASKTRSPNYDVPRSAVEPGIGKFIGGRYIELGFRTNSQVGKMGTDGKPSDNSFGGRDPTKSWLRGIGMTTEVDGRALGTTGTIIDYFLPGCPEEGFYAGYDGGNAEKNFGSDVEVSTDSEFAYATITGSTGNLHVEQTIMLGLEDRWFRNDITLTNTGGSDMTRVRFMRSHDPDDTVDQSGSYSTYQKILNCGGPLDAGETERTCPSGSVGVSATSGDDNYRQATGNTAKVIYYSNHPNAWASYGPWGLSPSGVYDDRVWAPQGEAGTGDYSNVAAPGSERRADAFIAMCFEFATLPAGQKVDMVYWTALDNDAIPIITGNVEAAADGPEVAPPNCQDHVCPDHMRRMEPEMPCLASLGMDTCRHEECCVAPQSCAEFLCHEYGEYTNKAGAGELTCAGEFCSDVRPEEGTNDDIARCCDMECSQYTAANCPTTGREPTNACVVADNLCTPDCRTFRTIGACSMHARCTNVDQNAAASNDLCVGRGDCVRDGHACLDPKVPKGTFPPFCVGPTCTDDDCCGMRGVCSASDCDAGFFPKESPIPLCNATTCTNEWCCDALPAGVAAHFTGNLGSATRYDFMMNCTLMFPYVRFEGQASALNLHVMPAPVSGKIVDAQDNTVCRVGDIEALKPCIWQYNYNDESIVAKSPSLCAGASHDWECCLKHNVDGTITSEKCSTCIGSGSSCNWCNMIVELASRTFVLLPMTGATCVDTSEACKATGASCRCIAAQQDSSTIELKAMDDTTIQAGFDETTLKDCRMRFAGVPTPEDLEAASSEFGVTQSASTISYTGSFYTHDARAMRDQILALDAETSITAICMTSALNADIVAPGTSFVWPVAGISDVPGATHPIFTETVGAAMMMQLAPFTTGGDGPVDANALKEGVHGKIIAPASGFVFPR